MALGAGKCVSTQTIRNRLHEAQLFARVPAAGLPLTVQHRVRRLARGHRHHTWTIEWHRVLFTDEYLFYLWKNEGCGDEQENARNQPISLSVIPVLHWASWVGVA
ncbi:hypothetical protein TNCV_3845861 [Trichonephila clavipes]|nr:hypothetical protein TNCV_3845861 [Trichonephila clavipes]